MSSSRSVHLGAAVLSVVLSACCRAPAATRPPEHPVAPSLAGTIWDVAAGRAIERGALLPKLVAARIVLLGETHDNPRHHAWQADLLGALIAAGRRPSVAFEMVDTDQQADLEAALRAHPADLDILAHALAWADSGWPDFSLYRPIFAKALAAQLTVLGANLAREDVRTLARQGLEGFGADRAAALGIDRPLAADVEAALREEMSASHCGMLPASHMGGMVLAQRARDAQIAAVLGAASGDGAVGFVGTGHARTDRGVPARLREIAPDSTVVSVGLLEVDPELGGPDSYAEIFGAHRLPFDVVVFTDPEPREDPCAAFAHR